MSHAGPALFQYSDEHSDYSVAIDFWPLNAIIEQQNQVFQKPVES